MQRKLVVSFGVIILFFIIILMIIGCDKKENINIVNSKIGLIKVPEKMNKTKISFLSGKLDVRKTINVNVGGMSDTECKPIKYNNKIYMVCNDMLKKDVDSKLITIDSKNNSYTLYNSAEYINDFYVDKHIYTISSKYNEQNVSYIERIGADNYEEDKFKLRISNIILTEIYVKGDYIYATGFNYNDITLFSKLYIINKSTMNIEKELDISQYIIDVTDMSIVNDTLYIGGRTKKNVYNEEIMSKELIKIDLKSYMCEKIYIGNNVGQMTVHKGKLYMSNYDSVLDKGNEICVYDIADNQSYIYELKDCVRDMMLKGNKLYVLGKENVFKYKINAQKDGKLKCIQEKKLEEEYISFLKN